MSLTQQQLAAMAKVSTPTVSRFEQAERNVQLSSVLAILEILGMTDTRTLTFPDQEYRYASDEGVTFYGQDGPRRIKCKISREALDDHFSDRGRLRPEDAFLKYRRDVEGVARRKYLTGRVEPDGSVLISTLELV